jgi:hypothetical protein
MSSVALTLETDRSISDDSAGYWVQLPVVHSKNDALNWFLKSSAEKEQDAYEAVLQKISAHRKSDTYVERYVDPRFQSAVCKRITSDSFIPDDHIQLEMYHKKQAEEKSVKQSESKKSQGILSKFNCFTPRVKE